MFSCLNPQQFREALDISFLAQGSQPVARVRLVEIIDPLIDASVGLGSEGAGDEGVILVVLFFILILVIFLSFLTLINLLLLLLLLIIIIIIPEITAVHVAEMFVAASSQPESERRRECVLL